jgi:hypothetical protein
MIRLYVPYKMQNKTVKNNHKMCFTFTLQTTQREGYHIYAVNYRETFPSNTGST